MSSKIVHFYGRIALHKGDAEVISEVASLGKTYVEIGTLFGGSACIAGMAGCEVFCIDPLDGYYNTGQADTATGIMPSEKIVRRNWENCGLDQSKLHLSMCLHPPWPEEIDRNFDAGLIDGDHTYEGVLKDYLGMAGRVKYLMLHDTNKAAVGQVWSRAISDGWVEYIPKTKKPHVMGVLKR